MSEDSRSTKLRKFYYVANPGSGDSDDAKEDPSRTRSNGSAYSSKKAQVSAVYHYHRPTPSQPHMLAIDSSVSRQHPQPPLSSPVSTGSPSTPPPTTPNHYTHSNSNSGDLQVDSPSRSLPVTDLGSYHDYRAPNEAHTTTTAPSRTVRLIGHLKAPFGSRPRAPDSKTRRPHTASPTVTTPDSYAPQSSSASTSTSTSTSEKVIFATSDSERFVTVDISSAKNALQIRELILTKLNIFTEDELYPYAISRTEIGSSEVGEALTNDRLMAICRDFADPKGNLKFLVSHSATPTPPPPPPPPSSSHATDYPAPPVLPHLASINPLRVKRRSRSRGGSLSSTSENLPLEVGYDADLENLDREAIRPPARTNQSAPTVSPAIHPPSPHRRPSLANQPRPSSPLLQSQEPASTSSHFSQSSDRAKTQKKEGKYGHALPPLPTPPPVSPTRPSFPINEETSSLALPPNRHPRSSSDAAADLDSLTKAAEQYDESSTRQLRIRDYPSLQKIKAEPSRDNLRDRQTRRVQDEDDASWEIVMPPSQRDELDRMSPSLQRGSRPPVAPSRYRPTSPYTSRHNLFSAPRQSQPTAPLPLQDSRPSTQPRAGRVVHPSSFIVNWKGEEGGSSRKPTPPSATWSSTNRLTKNATKSMDNLKISASSPSSRRMPPPQLPVSRPTTSSRELPYSPSNLNVSNLTLNGVPKSYDPPRNGFTRPLPVQGSSHGPTDYYTSSHSYSRGGTYTSSSTNNDPYPRPQSAAGDSVTSPTKGYNRLQSPVYGSTLDSGEANRSPRTISPNRLYHSPGIPGPRPRPNHSGDRSGSSDIQSGPETSNTTPPRTPISPQSPHYDSNEKNGIMPEPSPPTSPEGLTMNDHSAESTLKQEDQHNFSNMLKSTTQPQPQTTLTRQLTPPPPLGIDGDDDEDSDNGGGTWIVRPEPTKNASRPPLTVQIGPADTASVLEPSRPEVPPKDGPPSSYRPPIIAALKNASRRPESTFVDPEGDNWARPPPENIYEHLEKFFPKHDLDKPVIEATSGDTSPTNAEPLAPLPPPVHLDERARIRAKKSIRIVAQEHKKRIDRTSRAAETTAYNDNIMRKRSTKLWGSKLEEVTTAQGRNASTNSLPESPPGGPTTFKWVRGELIGKGTYGRVYLALNATTGEMIAVKQVELPQTASDKNDSRQHTVVQALKSESETLRDLDHPNIVQYLGFEETPANLSIFLEYVPGGSIGSCLHKHGKFEDNVTRSFTAQILSGLEYLHSKGILHRDMKADNILVEMSGTCKISDFGISKRTEDLQGGAFTAMQGTVFWMAPEVINTNKKGYNFKIDIWSVGCVVLEMWAGSRPWMGEEMVAVMFKLYQAKQPPPVPEDVSLSEDADDFRRKCFAINPEERPSATELRKHPYLILPPDWVFTGFT